MSIEFPLSEVHTKLGIIPTPLLTISVLTKSGYQRCQFLFDTGADFTMLPKYMAEDTGLKLSGLAQVRTFGIENKGITAHIGNIKIKIADTELKIRCLFSEKDTTPFILGRVGIFSHFNIFIDNRRNKIRFIPL